jgi:hypothetical protein
MTHLGKRLRRAIAPLATSVVACLKESAERAREPQTPARTCSISQLTAPAANQTKIETSSGGTYRSPISPGGILKGCRQSTRSRR